MRYFYGRVALAVTPSQNAPEAEEALGYQTCVGMPPFHKHCTSKRATK